MARLVFLAGLKNLELLISENFTPLVSASVASNDRAYQTAKGKLHTNLLRMADFAIFVITRNTRDLENRPVFLKRKCVI